MVRASSYVLKDISNVLENRDLSKIKELYKLKELFDKFSARYSEDSELIKICEKYSKYLENKDLNKLNEIKMSLNVLRSTRTKRTALSDGLWFKNRRPNTVQSINVI